ncbi:MAG: sulfatase [Planctomycetota bacterium]|jgi:arylsulfatase A-like enzyme
MNIILIISDTFRWDNLFDRAEMPVRTPHLDSFAERAVSCERMFVSSFPTIPHRTDVTSGRYGWPWYPWQDRRQGTKNHAPSILRSAGYVSQLLCDCPHLFNAGFQFGFDGALVTPGQEGNTFFLRMNHPITETMPREKTRTGRHFQGRNLPDISHWTNQRWRPDGEEDRFPPRTAGLAVEWLEENYRHEPFFLWVDFFDPHEPWDPPEYMVRRYDADYSGTPMIHPNYGHASDYTPEELRNLRAHYCAEAELVDRWVGRILQKIDDLDLWRNSIVVFTSDHGMSLGEHNRTGKSNINERDDRRWPIYPEIAHVPFMIAAPGLDGGREVGALVQPPDILPTLFDIANVPAQQPEPFHGKSFAPLLESGSVTRTVEAMRLFAVSACFIRLREGEVPANALTPVVYTQRWAYVPLGPTGTRELYDLAADPLAAHDVAAPNAAVCDELHAKLLRWLEKIKAPPEAAAPFRAT